MSQDIIKVSYYSIGEGGPMTQRTILVLIGPPGAGKDSLTQILAAHTDFSMYPRVLREQ